MGEILQEYAHLISKSPQDFENKYGKILPKRDWDVMIY
jgi:hypothetical protein